MPNRPNEEQAKQFDKFVKHWQTVLNLNDWRIEPGNRPARGAMASVECDGAARLATYRLGDFGNEKITPDSLSQTALHETLHVFLHELIAVAQEQKSTSEHLESAEHRVINVLERVLGEKYADTSNDR
jgi:hypothetical protein